LPFLDQGRTQCDKMREVDPEHVDCCPSDRRSSYKDRFLPPEMPLPFLPARVKEPDPPMRLRVNSREITQFSTVARETGPRQVGKNCRAVVLLRDDVVGLESHRRMLLGQLAVFATRSGSLADPIL
jgi:hypothetical protein